jgi:dATP pyrophosphohydrolase
MLRPAHLLRERTGTRRRTEARDAGRGRCLIFAKSAKRGRMPHVARRGRGSIVVMPQAPLQVLVIPFRLVGDERRVEFAVFRRPDPGEVAGGSWHFIVGGAHDGETPEHAARRELFEVAGVRPDVPVAPLDSAASIPATHFPEHERWGPDCYVVPERAYAARLDGNHALTVGTDHPEFRWVDYPEAKGLLKWDSNRTALWELHERLNRAGAGV